MTSPTLRPYQEAAIISCARYGAGGHKRALIVLPTGTGKTVIFCAMAAMASKKVLVLAHREELLKQTMEKIHEADPLLTVTLEQANNRMDSDAKVVVASVQTLARSEYRLLNLCPSDFSLVILDEAHHATADSYIKILAHFGLMPDVGSVGGGITKGQWRRNVNQMLEEFHPDSHAPFLAGFTATPHRTDGEGLEWVFDEIVYSKNITEMMEAGWLCKIRGIRIGTGTDISKVKMRGGDFATGELATAINTEERNRLAVSAYQEHADGRSTIVFAADVEHAQEVTNTFRESGIRAEYVVGDRGRMEHNREDIIQEFRARELDVLVNCMVLTEGFDAPECSCIIMLRPTKSSLLYTQMMGRGTRIFPGKDDLLVLDIVDIAQKVGVASMNTLFGLPPKLQTPDDILEQVEAFKEIADEYALTDDMMDSVGSMDELRIIAKEFDPLSQAALPSHLESSYAWIKTSFGFALSIPDGPQIGIIENLLGQATVRIKVRGQAVKRLGTFRNIQTAMREADRHAEEDFPDGVRIIQTNARWRRDKPSEKQLAAAKKLHIRINDHMTKGDVSVLLNARFAGRG